jgi:type VI secretion system Hcp family effector
MKLHFWQVDSKGIEKEFYTITITDAQISSVQTLLPNIFDHGQLRPSEVFAIRYSKIEWLIIEGNVMAEDDWYAPTR